MREEKYSKWLTLVCKSYLELPSFPLTARRELKTNNSCKTTATIIRKLWGCFKPQAAPPIWMNLRGGRTMLVHTYTEQLLIPKEYCLLAPLNMRFVLKMERSPRVEVHWVKRGQFVLKWVQFQSPVARRRNQFYFEQRVSQRPGEFFNCCLL